MGKDSKSDDPCKQLKDEYKAVLKEYIEAGRAASAFVSVKTVGEVGNPEFTLIKEVYFLETSTAHT